MNNRYNRGYRSNTGRTSGSDTMAGFMTALIFFAIIFGIFFFTMKSEVGQMQEDLEIIKTHLEERDRQIDSLRYAKPAPIAIPKKEETLAKTYRKKSEKDTSKSVPEKPKEIPQAMPIQDTAR
jgi:hypothetical protein